MRKFTIDTNVILLDPHVITALGDNDVYISLLVVEELDSFKKGQNHLGGAAREFSRHLDSYRQKASNLGLNLVKDGVPIRDNGEGRLFILMEDPSSTMADLEKHGIEGNKTDNKIIAQVKSFNDRLRRSKQKGSKEGLVLITKDFNMRIKVDALGIVSEDYENSVVQNFDSYINNNIDHLEDADIALLHEQGTLPNDWGFPLFEHIQIYSVNDHDKEHPTVIYAWENEDGREYITVKAHPRTIYGISAKNVEQQILIHELLDEDKICVSVVGKAGCGKTLLAFAAALEMVVNRRGKDGARCYDKVVLARPVVSVGKEIGYLPGTEREKLDPFMVPFYDAFDVLHSKAGPKMKGEAGFKSLESQGMIEVQAISSIRGRSFKNCILVIDEAQNLTPHEVKTICTRVGEGTKIILCGDIYQIDTPYMDSESNGVSHTIAKLRGEPTFAYVHLTKGERSSFAELAARLL